MLAKVLSQSTNALVSKSFAFQNSQVALRNISHIPSKNFQRNTSLFANKFNASLGNRNGSIGFSYLSSKSNLLAKLWRRNTPPNLKEANENPDDATKQEEYLKSISTSWNEVIERCESGKYAMNEESTKIYLDALNYTNQLGKLKITQSKESTIVTTDMLHKFIPARPSSFGRLIDYGSKILMAASAAMLIYFLWSADREEEPPVKKTHTLATNSKVKFADVKGIDEVKDDLEEVVQYLKNPDKFTKLGAKLPKGVLLCGEPGTGKTLLARAVAGEAEVPFLYASGSSFDEIYVGVGPKRIRDLFADARALAPCIVFIDELDAVGASRKYSVGSNSKESTLNQLLTELDGFQQTEGIIIIGATNIPDALDSALVRPGRFDKQVFVYPPDVDGRKDILNLYLKKTRPAPDVNVERIAKGTTGFTGADLFNLINQSAIKAAVRGAEHVDMKTIEESRDDIIMGGKKRELFMSDEEKLMTAYHESGHTLVAIYSEGAYPVHKATIAPRGNALGVTSFLPEDMYSRSRKQMKASLKVAMGGRAAEELIYGDDGVNTGASNDFMNATNMARKMVGELGFSEKIGKVHHDGKKQISEKELQLIDSEIKSLIDNSYSDAKNILNTHKKELHLLANALLEHETLSVEEIKDVIAGKKLQAPVVKSKEIVSIPEEIVASPEETKKPSKKGKVMSY